ncbi:inorganic pyrophosphatase [Emiliania huxleyi CCMP1516]|uniref:inorganic diphosphatase n=2 Tax=Emiliania huxleyi TaxID=2903 RepID=A0A0D3J5V7_EMIH1|nr:inorganic pyrophosphatase [Emiliania huxleyi CCMP1516]EOD18892.1 inorganic pyrophosphatase [Emiliania huxleyi CCMP1516]|mmetsp:Transcript_25433/g.74978  ORF Transcript_25433/g.74978 Transcript_25433/m.74978 type:complete len:486 (-) Transcript_25433:40-1497(-)|eukprot:CAMPEP_0196712958 /NCGR_PEP_ID=MMETSP1090-20130531/74968_1 /TAXON_ID=37098 /ORGANISM="Isochrysis sp, Strain CCMP1244" /LENGTH=485 /DNA_ID=CAMNT_0042053057 /DNA_START=40 /DNA_END=1497 /DNA_ORIENTATION=+
MNEQLALIEEAFRRARSQPLSGVPIDIAVARQYGDSTVTLRTQLPARGGNSSVQPRAAGPSGEAFTLGDLSAVAKGKSDEGVDRKVSTASFFDPPSGGDGVARGETSLSWADGESSMQVGTLLAEIERLKRKALSRGVNLTSPQEDVPAEDVAMLRQVFIMADSTSRGSIELEELKNLHHVLGEPLTESEAASAFKAMDSTKSGTVNFEDFLAWYTLAHSSSGMLSKKGQAYTNRFKKMMGRIGGQFKLENITVSETGQSRSLEYRVNFFYNDHGHLKQISPWHDIPLYANDGAIHFITEIPKFSRAKFEIATGEVLNPIKQDVKNGKLRDYNFGDMLFNYGAFPQTWEDPQHTTPDTGHIGDNDPIDAVEIGTKILKTGSVTKVKILGCLAMIDDGETDWKCIVINVDDILAPRLNDIDDVEAELPGFVSTLREWLRMYKTVDGKPQNEFGLDEKAVGREYTLKVIAETHEFWKRLTASGAKTV